MHTPPSSLVRPALGIFLVSILFGTLVQHAGAVRRGITATGGNSIFMFSGTPPGTTIHRVGTTTAVEYKRCLVTARHLVDGIGTDGTIVAGVDLRNATNAIRRQEIAVVSMATPEAPSTDFAVLWLKDLQDEGGVDGVKRIHEYELLELKKAENFGLSPIDYETYSASGSRSTGAPVPVWMVGYGMSGTVMDTDVGIKVKRYGFPDGIAYYPGDFDGWGVEDVPGSMIRTVRGSGGHIGCTGDSGSPLQKKVGGGVYGVLHAGGDTNCEDTETNLYATFDDQNDNGGKTNWERLKTMVKETCGRHVFGFKWPHGDGGSGYVSGVLEGGQVWPPISGIQFNDTILMGDGTPNQDFREFVHEGQDMVLTAVPGANSLFVRWEQYGLNTPYGNCPCYGSSNPVCRMDYDEVGYYDVDTSFDASGCYAVFGPYEEPPVSSSSSEESSSSEGV